MAIEYYAQRASAASILTEGTTPSDDRIGYIRTPAIERPEHVAASKKITGAVSTEDGARKFEKRLTTYSIKITPCGSNLTYICGYAPSARR